MYIESIRISSFGNLNDFSLDFSSGINILEGNNESGKSTVADFIKFIFYGFTDKAEREKHLSFSSGNAGGSAVVCDGTKKWRIERQSNGSRETVSVFSSEDGTKCFEGKVPGEVFFGMPCTLFESTAFVGQTGGGRIDGRQTSQAVENLLFSADESIDLKKALKKLETARIELLHKNKKGGRIFENENRISELTAELASSSEENAEIIRLKNSDEELERKIGSEEKALKITNDRIEDYRILELRSKKEKIRSLEKEYGKAVEEYDGFIRQNTRNGFFPDMKYHNSIKDCIVILGEKESKLSEVRKRLDDLNEIIEKDHIDSERIAAEEKAEKSEIIRKKNIMLGAALICCIFLILAGVGAGILLTSDRTLIGSIVGIMAALCLTGLIVGLALAARYNQNLRNFNHFTSTKEDMYNERLDKIRDELSKAETEKNECRSALDALCGKWELVPKQENIAELKNVIEKARALSDEAEKRRYAYVNFKTSVETGSELEPEDDGREISLPEKFDAKDMQRRAEFLNASIVTKKELKHSDELKLTRLSATVTPPSELLERIEVLKAENVGLQKQYQAYVTAYDAINAASEKMRASVSPKLSEYAGGLMDAVTDGKYREIGVDSSLSLSFRPENGEGDRVTKDSCYMSAGTADAAYISLRLAIISLVSGESGMPMIFDESFSRIDDSRLEKILKILSSANTQVFILTSLDREEKLLCKAEIGGFSLIHL